MHDTTSHSFVVLSAFALQHSQLSLPFVCFPAHFPLTPDMCVLQVYYQECEMFGLVAKMLIAKDQSLERSIQSSLQENLRDIGKHCVEAMEKFIEDYDSRELSR